MTGLHPGVTMDALGVHKLANTLGIVATVDVCQFVLAPLTCVSVRN